MSNLLQLYLSLSSSSPRTESSSVLKSIIAGASFDGTSRRELITALLQDLKIFQQSKQGSRISSAEAAQALLAVKTLARDPAGSDFIAESSNLSFLLLLSKWRGSNPEISKEALRCVANALLLIEQARNTWVDATVGGGSACIDLLQGPATPDQLFLVSRILFLCTASRTASSSFIREVVEKQSIIKSIGAKLDGLVLSIHEPMASEAMADLLKFVFNLLVNYPKIANCDIASNNNEQIEEDSQLMSDNWNSKLDDILPPLLRVFEALSHPVPVPLASPLTHVIHALITIPISPTLHSVWFPSTSRTEDQARPVDDLVTSPIADQVALVRSEDRKNQIASINYHSPPSSLPISHASSFDVLHRAYSLFDASLVHHLPGSIDPDDQKVHNICQKSGLYSLDDTLRPLTLLITRLCLGDPVSRARMRNWIIPADLDRTHALEGRADTLGRCLRLLSSVYHANLKDAVGEMLFAVCDSDAATLCSLVGYGNVAGFLFHKGVSGTPPSSTTASLTTPSGIPINPITGVIEREVAPPDMTDEEKEIEAEKLFVLFDRLEKTGAIHPSQNPIRKAMQGG